MDSRQFCMWLSGFFDSKVVGQDSPLGRIKAKLEQVDGFQPNHVSVEDPDGDEGREFPVVTRKEILTRKRPRIG